MSKLKYILVLVLLNTGLLMAVSLKTSDDLNNLEIITDTDCSKKNINTNSQKAQAQVASKTHKVETVNYTLHGCSGDSSFPVTVRSYKRQGE